MTRLLLITGTVLALTACGTCIGANPPTAEECADNEGPHVGRYQVWSDTSDLDGAPTVLSGDTLTMTIVDAEGNVWEARWDRE